MAAAQDKTARAKEKQKAERTIRMEASRAAYIEVVEACAEKMMNQSRKESLSASKLIMWGSSLADYRALFFGIVVSALIHFCRVGFLCVKTLGHRETRN